MKIGPEQIGSLMTTKLLKKVGEMADDMLQEPPGTHLSRMAERLRLGLPANLTEVEMLAEAAEAKAHRLIAEGAQPSMTLEELAQKAPLMDAKYRRNRLGRAAPSKVD